jgi:addiction module RelE/StbE family toxin
MWTVLESKKVVKQLDKCPKEIIREFEAWKQVVELSGPIALRRIGGFRDHALKGQWQGARSSYLNIQWRVIYVVIENLVQVRILEVTPHDYRKKR